jgi:hypothetical protein
MRRRSQEDGVWGGRLVQGSMGCVRRTGTAFATDGWIRRVSRERKGPKNLLEARMAGGNITTSNGLGSLSASARRKRRRSTQLGGGSVANTRKLNQIALFWRGYWAGCYWVSIRTVSSP